MSNQHDNLKSNNKPYHTALKNSSSKKKKQSRLFKTNETKPIQDSNKLNKNLVKFLLKFRETDLSQ
jgi:hypothetical protein